MTLHKRKQSKHSVFPLASLGIVSHMSMFVSLFLSEQRKKYSNSNVIMQETSQYHVQVSEMLNS